MSEAVALPVAAQVTIALFALGVTFAAGRFAARLDALETWRLELRRDLDGIFTELRSLRALIKGEED